MSGAPATIREGSSGVLGDHAVISGLAAAALAGLVPRRWRGLLLDAGLGSGEVAEVEAAIAALAQAAGAWRGRQVAVSAGGNIGLGTEGNGSAGAPESFAWISTRTAARLLGCSERRVTQLCAAGQLDADKVAGRWLIRERSVSARRTTTAVR